MSDMFITCDNLVKIYKIADLEVVALQGLDLEVQQGEIMALVGASGSGKTTLLNVIGGLDTPSAGRVQVGGSDLLELDSAQRVLYKRDMVGFVWQQPGRNLLPYLSARENVEVPMMLRGRSARWRRDRALELLELLGLADQASLRPDQLSGGQQQRAALAVALANNPPLLLADEPTGQLDSDMAQQIFTYLRRLNNNFNTTIIVVTHDPNVAARVDRVIGIRDGRTSTEIRRRRNVAGETTHEEEWVLLDRTGRMQIPGTYVETLALHGRVMVRLESGHLSVWPGQKDVGTGSESPAPPINLRRRRKAMWDSVQQQLAGRPEQVAPPEPAVKTQGLNRIFESDVEVVHAVREVSITIPTGVLALIRGRSGSGKTTLLNLIGGLDEPTSGQVAVAGTDMAQLPDSDRILIRRQEIGFVFQTFGLLPFLSAQENVEIPLRLVRAGRVQRQKRATELLNMTGLLNRANHRVHELSGGEQQRVALARALANQPTLILADEPTGQLDSDTGTQIISLLRQIVDDTGVTVIIASHDPKVEEAADLIFEQQDGQIVRIIDRQE